MSSIGTYPHAQIWATLIVVLLIGLVLGFARKVLFGADKRLSTSKTVTFIWTLFVVWVFGTVTMIALTSNTPLQIQPVTDQYLLLLGGPFGALVAAKGIVTAKLTNGTLQKTAGDNTVHPTDLISNDAGYTDLVDLQFTLFNLVALLWTAGSFIQQPIAGLPNLPAGLASLTTVSALTYITNKAVQQNPPRITTLSPTSARVGDLVSMRGMHLMPPTPTTATGGAVVDPTPVIMVGGQRANLGPNPTDTLITFTVPPQTTAGPDEVTVTLSTGDATDGTGVAAAPLTILP